MKAVHLNPNKHEQFMRRIKAFDTHKPQEFVISSAPDIAEWDNYRLYILLDNIKANRQHKYTITTKDYNAVLKRIKAYGKMYKYGLQELIYLQPTEKNNEIKTQ